MYRYYKLLVLSTNHYLINIHKDSIANKITLNIKFEQY